MSTDHYIDYRIKLSVETMMDNTDENRLSFKHSDELTKELLYISIIYLECNTYDKTYSYSDSFFKFLFNLRYYLDSKEYEYIIINNNLSYVTIFSDKELEKNIISKIKILEKNVNISYNIVYSAQYNLFDNVIEINENLRPMYKEDFYSSLLYKKICEIRYEDNT